MGHASGGGVTDNIHPVARQIFEKMKEHGGKGHYGIRVDEESQAKVGDSHPRSREWVNGNPTNRLLPGVSAIKAPKNPRGIHNALRGMNLLEKAEGWNTPYYSGTLVHLIHSPEAPLRGEDKGEGIFKQPTLVGRWMKANAGRSPVLPNQETRANGGEIDKDGVPVAVAGGEHVLAPHEVMFAGNGDLDAGHRALDEFVIRQRAKNVKTLKKLPGPRRD